MDHEHKLDHNTGNATVDRVSPPKQSGHPQDKSLRGGPSQIRSQGQLAEGIRQPAVQALESASDTFSTPAIDDFLHLGDEPHVLHFAAEHLGHNTAD